MHINKSKLTIKLNHYKFIPLILALIVYANTFSHGFVLDDESVITLHTYVQKGISGIPDLLTSPYRYGFSGFNDGLYRPLSLIIFAIEVALFGNNPLPFHVLNVIVFAFSCLMLYNLLILLLGEKQRFFALAVSCFFAIHPLHTEVVANIKSLDEQLCFIFFLLSTGSAYQYLKNGSINTLLLMTFFFVMSFLSKESALTFVAAIPLTMYFFTKWNTQRFFTLTISLILIAAIYWAWRNQILESTGTPSEKLASALDNSLTGASFIDRIGMGFYLTLYYIYLFLVPINLGHDYSYNQIPLQPILSALPIASILIISALLFFALRGFKKKSPFSYGILFFFITISIYTNIVEVIGVTLAERFAFVPSLGLTIAGLYFLSRTTHVSLEAIIKHKKWIFITLTGCLALYGIRTIDRNLDWESNVSLFTNDIHTVPNSIKAHFNYATSLRDKSRLTANPEQKDALRNEAVKWYQKALDAYPKYTDAENNLATILMEGGKYAEAVPYLEHIVEERPLYRKAHYNLGACYVKLSKYTEAISELTTYCNMDNTNAQAYYHLGVSYGNIGDFTSAINALNRAITINPNYWESYLYLGKAYGIQQEFNQSLNVLLKAYKIINTNEDINMSIALTYMNLSKFKEAVPYLQSIVKLNPQNQQAINLLNEANKNASP